MLFQQTVRYLVKENAMLKKTKKHLIGVLLILNVSAFAMPVGEVLFWQNESELSLLRYEKNGQYGVIEGDILIGQLVDLQRPGAVVRKNSNSRWPNALMPYVIDKSLSLASRTATLLAIGHFENHTGIRFIERNEKNKDKYPDYVTFKDGNECSSFVGKIGGNQPIILNEACGYGVAIHEISHALGVWHEQNRIDRDDYVRIHYENIQSGLAHNFNQQINDSIDLGAYDYASIMHYSAYAFSKNGKKTISVKQGKHAIGQRNGLSKGDIKALNRIYQ